MQGKRPQERDTARRKEYVAQCKQVKWAAKCDREQWWVGQLTEMDNDLKRNRQGDFFKMKRPSGNKVTPADTILDESGQPLQKIEEKPARWRRHFEKVLNVDNAVSEEVMVGIMDNADVETPDVTREEVEKAMTKLKNGKAAGNDNIAAELLKNGGEAMVDWVTELVQEVWRTRKVPQEWKDRLKAIIDPQLMEAQCGFRKGRGTVDQLWVVQQVVERATEYRTPLYLCFVDLTKAYDFVNQQAMTAVLKRYRVPQQLVEIICTLELIARSGLREVPLKNSRSTLVCGRAVFVPPLVQLFHGQDPERGNRLSRWRSPHPAHH